MKVTGMWAVHEFMNSIPYLNMVVSTALNFVPFCQVWCAALYNGHANFVATGSLSSGLKVGVISAAAGYALQGVGNYFDTVGTINQSVVDAGIWAKDGFIEFGGSGGANRCSCYGGGISAELMGGTLYIQTIGAMGLLLI
ncbi:hypothetical protein [uncultured Shewanella sp.]|uniref:hypothetical protein n=1 Tax=uncultured Shewanella sp. TaxID=173975 RepID=UPI00262904AD|nr:hypothetical protein [uncultured Shewanella sp.]